MEKTPVCPSGKSWKVGPCTVTCAAFVFGEFVQVDACARLEPEEAEELARALLRAALLVRERRIELRPGWLFQPHELSEPLSLA